MLGLIDYGLIPVFFVGIILLILMIARPGTDEAAAPKESAPPASGVDQDEDLSSLESTGKPAS